MGDQELLDRLKDAVVQGDGKKIRKLAQETLDAGVDPYKALTEGCARGIEIASEKYCRNEMFILEIILSAEAMYAAFDVLKPCFKEKAEKGKVVLGVVGGDVHDIGKNVVKLLLEAAGFEVIDLGKNVPLKGFVEKIKETDADIVGMSAFMTVSILGMYEVIKMIEGEGLRDKVKIMVGGAPITQEFAGQIGADGYAKNGRDGVKVAEKLMMEKGGFTS